MTTLLADPSYSQCHEVFRRVTNQTDLMLDQLVARTPMIGGPGIGLSICSVGCGAGLFPSLPATG